MRRMLVVMGAVLFVTPVAVARASVPIQPGMLITAGSTQCTAAFIFDGTGAQAGHVYVATAGHCVESQGQAVMDGEGTTIGKVVAFESASTGSADAQRDWALFEVPADQVGRVDPSVVGHPDLPRGGLPDAAHVSAGDAVQFSGFGQPWVTPDLQQGRTGTLLTFAEPRYWVRGPIFFGDSGGPVVDLVSGRAVGVVSITIVYGPPLHLYETGGPTPGAVISQAAAAGVNVALRTVEGGRGALPLAATNPVRADRPRAPKIRLAVDYLLARRSVRLGGRSFVVSAWLRGRRLELTLVRRKKVISRARKRVSSVPAEAGLAIRAPRGRLSAHGVLRYGSKRIHFRVSAKRIAFVR